jgi:hypothetical protein
MSYNAALAPPAMDKFLRPSPILAGRVDQALERLCLSPTSLSHRSHFPYPPQFQVYETRIEHHGEQYRLNVFFRYSQDEQTLLIDDFTLFQIS